jgi:hypothetical protein
MRIQQTFMTDNSKRIAAATGLTAAALMVAITIASGGNHDGQSVVAGSGEGSAGGLYTQPAVGGMTVGATETWQSPASVLATAKAVPAIKAQG